MVTTQKMIIEKSFVCVVHGLITGTSGNVLEYVWLGKGESPIVNPGLVCGLSRDGGITICGSDLKEVKK